MSEDKIERCSSTLLHNANEKGNCVWCNKSKSQLEEDFMKEFSTTAVDNITKSIGLVYSAEILKPLIERIKQKEYTTAIEEFYERLHSKIQSDVYGNTFIAGDDLEKVFKELRGKVKQ